MHSGDLFKVAAMHYHNIILFFEPALVLVDLAFERFDREIDRLLETFCPGSRPPGRLPEYGG